MEGLIKQIQAEYPEFKDHVQVMQRPTSDEPLYTENDSVIILDDASFLGKKIISDKFQGPGLLEAYATWCPHCQSKVRCINVLADLLKDTPQRIYVIDADINDITARELNVRVFPSFYHVNQDGTVGKEIELNSMKDLTKALCQQNKKLCGLKYDC